MPRAGLCQPRLAAFAAFAALTAAVGLSLGAAPTIGEREVVTISVATLDVPVLEPAGGLPERRVDPERGATVAGVLGWPAAGDRSRLRVEATVGADARRVALRASLTLPDGRRVRTERTLGVGDGTALVELHRVGRRPLTLAIDLGVDREPFVEPVRAPGRAVRMLLEVQRVDAGRVDSLETNQLQGFVGRSVSYSFRVADDDGGVHAVRVRLHPRRVHGALATIGVEIEGTLPGESAPSMIARTESLVLSRGASSTLAVEVGTPPSGYRFVVTALF